MFARIKKAGRYEYLQVVENHREKGKSVQRVIATLGRMDHLKTKGDIENVARSLSRFSEKPLLLLSEKSEGVRTEAREIGPFLVFERLWQELNIPLMLHTPAAHPGPVFSLETAAFLATLSCLPGNGHGLVPRTKGWNYHAPGRDYPAPSSLSYALSLLGGTPFDGQGDSTGHAASARDALEHGLFSRRRHMGSHSNTFFLYAAPIPLPYSDDKAPATQDGSPVAVAGIILDGEGYPLCSEVWAGPSLEPRNLALFLERSRRRFTVVRPCLITETAAIGTGTAAYLEEEEIPYILGAGAEKEGGHGLRTNTGLGQDRSALIYGRLFEFREMLTGGLCTLGDHMIALPGEESTRGLVLAAFLALILRKELDRRLCAAGHSFDWACVRDNLSTLLEVTITDGDRRFSSLTECTEICKSILRATGTSIPSAFREAPPYPIL